MQIQEIDLRNEVEKRYLAYALSTIVSRALPDVRDGLKPVHRRILFAMSGMGLAADAKFRKSAAVVGEVLGKFHPHGDQAAYDALVRLAQDFSLRYPLIDGSGNFGSTDGDRAAAMRYTEVRMDRLAGELLEELPMDTVPFGANYDGTIKEPAVLPARFPNLLANGTTGIAVGMSCSFPPHNLTELVTALKSLIKNPARSVRELLRSIKGPDFPTGGTILCTRGELAAVYEEGKGTIKLRGDYEVEPLKRGRWQIVFTSIPYGVNKAKLIERIASFITERKLPQLQDVRDESAEDVRIVLEPKSTSVRPETITAYVYKHADLEIAYPVNFTTLTPEGAPERLSLKELLRYFLDFRFQVVTRRLEFELGQITARLHILAGLEKVFLSIDEAIALIRKAKSRKEALESLMRVFRLDEEQARAVLEIRLYNLVGEEVERIRAEAKARRIREREIRALLESEDKLWDVVGEELDEIQRKYGDDRRTRVKGPDGLIEYNPLDYEVREETTVVLSRNGWIRRVKSVTDPTLLKFKEGDGLAAHVDTDTRSLVSLYSTYGKIYTVRAALIPAGVGFGEPVHSLVRFSDGEVVAGLFAGEAEAPEERNGEVPETAGDNVDEPDEGEQLGLFSEAGRKKKREKKETPPRSEEPKDEDIRLVITSKGFGFRFDESKLGESVSKTGKRWVKLSSGDAVAALMPVTAPLVALATSTHLLIFPVEQIPVLSGPGKGARLMKVGNQEVVDTFLVTKKDRIILRYKTGEETVTVVRHPIHNRDVQGKKIKKTIEGMEKEAP